MPTLSPAEIRAAARARAKAATEALPDLEARFDEAASALRAARDAERAARSALDSASATLSLCSSTPSAALALIRLVESAPHLIDALKAKAAKRPIHGDDHASLIRRKLVNGQGGYLTHLGAQVLRLHAEITEATTEDKQ